MIIRRHRPLTYPLAILMLGLSYLTPVFAANPSFAALLAELKAEERLAGVSARWHAAARVAEFYQQDEPGRWFDEGYPREIAHAWYSQLTRAADFGLSSEIFPLGELAKHLDTLSRKPDPRAAMAIELLLSDTFIHFTDQLAYGRDDAHLPQPRARQRAHQERQFKSLKQLLREGRISETLEHMEPPHSGYRQLRRALSHYLARRERGEGWPRLADGPTLRAGDNGARVKALWQRLSATDEQLKGTASTEFTDALAAAVKRFQQRHALPADGAVGKTTLAALNVSLEQRIHQINNNLERWRRLPHDLGNRYVAVNVPSFALGMIDGGHVAGTMKVVVGRKSRPTPIINDHVRYLVFNPYWHVPPHIAVHDIVPKVRKDPSYLTKEHLRVFERRGEHWHEISGDAVDWSKISQDAKRFPYLIRQDPGAANALGRVKFMFPNQHNIYLHDTPALDLMGKPVRGYSSGCVRVEKAYELARFLLNGDTRWSDEKIREAMAVKKGDLKEKIVQLPQNVPVYIQYWTAWADQEQVQFGNDFYGLDVAGPP